MRDIKKQAQEKFGNQVKLRTVKANSALRGFDCPACGKAAPFKATITKKSATSYEIDISGCCAEGNAKAHAKVQRILTT